MLIISYYTAFICPICSVIFKERPIVFAEFLFRLLATINTKQHNW